MSNSKYHIISLGNNCFLRKMLTDYGLKPTKSNDEPTCPFDLCVTLIKAVIQLLENDFKDYFNDTYFDNELQYWKNPKYNILYNHDGDYKSHEKDKFINRYTERINNFRNLLKENDFLYFAICNNREFKKEELTKLNNILNTLRKNKPFKLIAVELCEPALNEADRVDDIEYINVAHPYIDYHAQWWQKDYRNKSEAIEFERAFINEFKKIIVKSHELQIYETTLLRR